MLTLIEQLTGYIPPLPTGIERVHLIMDDDKPETPQEGTPTRICKRCKKAVAADEFKRWKAVCRPCINAMAAQKYRDRVCHIPKPTGVASLADEMKKTLFVIMKRPLTPSQVGKRMGVNSELARSRLRRLVGRGFAKRITTDVDRYVVADAWEKSAREALECDVQLQAGETQEGKGYVALPACRAVRVQEGTTGG